VTLKKKEKKEKKEKKRDLQISQYEITHAGAPLWRI